MSSINDWKGYGRPVEIAKGIFWVGFHDRRSNLHCNPYIIIGGDKAVLIDAGSRPDFAVVMMKILQTGIAPEQIAALIYHHFDPDLCGSMSNMVDICKNQELIVLSDTNNNIFLSYYIEREKRSLLRSIDEYGLELTFGERTLRFYKTPYAHSTGSFFTYDIKTKTLFSSDLFGSISRQWELFADLEDDCYTCTDYDHCIKQKKYCPLSDILEFHKKVMPSEKALRHAIGVIGNLDIEMIAPQHGSIFNKKKDIGFLIEKLGSLSGVGIDAF
ncbi:MAG: MBL fold metallo-hydrolase [Syntrophales bacterium LBB04]|nr:MBL fold metallo-hydrolase [Syntrophales bacterium LBB04]